jgi:uncharacterized protein YqjF (DUF2071 family)
MAKSSKVFLSAKWLDLIFLNYVVDPALLLPYVPPGTTLDSFAGKTYLSLVGFRFCETKLWGKISIPFHSEFEEVNLRFYVRRESGNELRRGVVFIKEIVPKAAIALTARLVYGENYVSLPMTHKVALAAGAREVEYAWTHRGQRSRLLARAAGSPQFAAENSLEQFITEHFWGYSRQKFGQSLEYQVTHEPWRVQIASLARFEGNAAALYGPELAGVFSLPPESAYIADGSSVEVLSGTKI